MPRLPNPVAPELACKNCGGSGVVFQTVRDDCRREVDCPMCKGTGRADKFLETYLTQGEVLRIKNQE